MKTTKILFVALVMGLFTATTVQAQEHNHNQGDSDKETSAMTKEMYVCPMHADEKSENPGKCPQCGMEMKKMASNNAEMNHGHMNHDNMNHGDMNHNNMNLESKESMGNDMASGYMCPMKCEGEKMYTEKGSCPKCGMDMKKVEMKNEEEHEH